jgi:hypothetical protein
MQAAGATAAAATITGAATAQLSWLAEQAQQSWLAEHGVLSVSLTPSEGVIITNS